MRIVLALLTVLIASSLRAEVENVVITWNALLCLDVCTPNLQANLQQIGGPTNVRINAQAGTAATGWNPSIPFSYSPYNTASRATGIRLSDIRVKVSGYVSQQGSTFTLSSTGDNSIFPLIGTLSTANAGGYIVRQNVADYAFNPDILEKLSTAASEHQLVTVEGPLFEPNRYTNTLIVEKLTVPKKPDDQQQQPQQ